MPENQKDYFDDLIQTLDDEVEEKQEEALSDEEQRRKNKDAEEARKRREAEAKSTKEEEPPVEEKVEPKEKAKEEAPKAEPKAENQATKTNLLGEQLVEFKAKYPEVDLSTLDRDTNFKRFIDGKILGKKDFSQLYEDYIDFTSSVSGRSQEELKANHIKKAQASSGSSVPKGSSKPQEDIFTQDELEQVAARIPLMNDKDAKKIFEKFDKSVEYYKNNKER
jgi:hypothetical protein